eukprot:m.402850 g.402850  ORF g.402850 m.402850 type:complete len:96 (-) comp28406_c1_seq56:1728-2015(-)
MPIELLKRGQTMVDLTVTDRLPLVASRSRWCTPCLQGLARFWLLEKFREHCASCLIKTTVASTDLTCLALAVHAETMVDIVGKSGALNRCHRFSI